jgi:2-furoate---CoA ligase
MRTAFDLVQLAAERTPDHLAIVDDRTDRAFTYRELLHEVDAIAAGLAARGITRGVRVATVLPNILEHALALLALQRLHAVPALLNYRLPGADVAALVRDGDIGGAIVRDDRELVALVGDALVSGGPLLTAGGTGDAAADVSSCRGDRDGLGKTPRPGPDDLALIFYTAGTTGRPKGVLISHRTSEPRLRFLSTDAGLRHGTHNRALGMAPLSHAIGFYGVFLATLAYSGTYYVMSAFNPGAAVDLIERNQITYLFGVPTMYQAIVSAPNYSPSRVSSLELVLHGGAPIQPTLLERLAREWPATIRHIYGATEIMSPLHYPDPVGQPTRLRQSYLSRVRIIREDAGPDDVVRAGEAGELIVAIDPDLTFLGYLNQPAATAEKLHDGWYFTGDVCVRRSDGDVDLVGRVDDVIRTGGESVYPGEVESVLAAHPLVRDACVVGVPDPDWGELVVACVVLSKEVTSWQELDNYFTSSMLARFKRPRAYLRLDALPRNAAGKVVRRELREAAIKADRLGSNRDQTIV